MSERSVVMFGAPTLAGLKTASLFNVRFDTPGELKEEIRRMNGMLASKGVRFIPLKIKKDSALIYIYRRSMLKRDLSDIRVARILHECGYKDDSTPEICIAQLMKKLKNHSEFPHEIGLFLGYPPEDVRGFIENKAGSCKLTGYWKVYGDEEKAKRLFERYKKCTGSYISLLEKGKTIDMLTVTK